MVAQIRPLIRRLAQSRSSRHWQPVRHKWMPILPADPAAQEAFGHRTFAVFPDLQGLPNGTGSNAIDSDTFSARAALPAI
jgi:hypothetical protein